MMKTYPCPYCGQTYRHPGMAERCMKRPLCRALNAPNGRIRREWEIQAGTLTIALFIASATEDQSEGESKEKARAVIAACDQICDRLRETLPVGKRVADAQAQRILDTAARVWGIGKKAMTVHLCEVITNLICDVEDHYREQWREGQDQEGKRLWTRLGKAVDSLYDALNPTNGECVESWRTPEAYEALRLTIWGPEKEARAPSVYLANDRIWVVARGRAEARDCLLRELGLARPKLNGVALGTVLEDGRTVGDLVPLAPCIPAIVARTTA